MSYRRRGGRRATRRKRVTREEMVRFYQLAGRRERMAIADARAKQLARWMKRFVVALSVVLIGLLVWRSM